MDFEELADRLERGFVRLLRFLRILRRKVGIMGVRGVMGRMGAGGSAPGGPWGLLRLLHAGWKRRSHAKAKRRKVLKLLRMESELAHRAQ